MEIKIYIRKNPFGEWHYLTSVKTWKRARQIENACAIGGYFFKAEECGEND